MPELPRIGYATGAPVGSASDYGTQRLRAGNMELPVQVKGSDGRDMVRQFKRELEKMRLTGGDELSYEPLASTHPQPIG